MEDAQVQGHQALGASAAESRTALEGARDIVLVVSGAGIILDANAAATRAYGYARSELLGMSILRLRETGAAPAVTEQMRAASERGVLFETVHIRKDGTRFPVEVNSSAIELGGESALVSVVRDISEREDRAKELQCLLDRSEEANRRLDGMLRMLSSAVSADDLDAILDSTVKILAELMATDYALFLVAENGGMRVRAQLGADEWTPRGYVLGPGVGFAGRVGQEQQLIYTENISASQGAISVHIDSGARAMLGVPVFVEGELFGVLECAWVTCRKVDAAERTMLQLAAERIARAISRARVLERTRRDERLTRAINEVSSLLNASLGVSGAIEPALQVAARALDCDVALYGTLREGMWRVAYSVRPEDFGSPLEIEADAFVLGTSEPTTMDRGSPAFAALSERFGIASAIAIPFHGRRDHSGIIILASSFPEVPFDDSTLAFATRIGETFSVALSNALHFETEHRIAEALQEALLTVPGSVSGMEFAHLYRSATLATRVGGDFFDVFEMADGRVGVLIGDVSGKGLEAAVLTSIIKDTIRAYAHETHSPAEVIAKANVVLERAATLPDFASVFFGVLHSESGRFRYCCAGHPPAAVLGPDGMVRLLECGSPVIGAFSHLDFVDHDAQLADDETVFLYTDGITESRRADLEFFGEQRMISVLSEASGLSVSHVPDKVFDAVMAFTDGRLSDDIAVLAFRRG